ncbi:MAG TPA: holo-ACP synthase [Methylomirabilota bacterium]
MTVRGIGVDLVHMPRLRATIERWQDRFLHRVFTPGEIAYCQARRDPVPHFAARFAAKEAGLKALGTGLRLGIRWRELEVQRERGQAPVLHLSGRSREIGLSRGGDRMLLALTHDGEYAMAHAIFLSEGAVEAPSEASPRKDGAGKAGARTRPNPPGRRRKRSLRKSR